MRKLMFFLLAALLWAAPGHAVIEEMGTGMLFGDNHSFNVTAPRGWVLDNQSAASQGVYMTFYPVGQTWKDSPVVVYGKAVTKEKEIKTVEDQVKSVVDEFHSIGSPNYTASRQPSIFLPDGKEAILYFFEGDQWGNYEAAAYFEEAATINYLVFNARNKKMFDTHLPAFKKMILSYKNTYVENGQVVDEENFKKLAAFAKRCSETPEGRKYENQFMDAMGQDIANYLGNCTSYLSAEKITDFDIILKIEPDGKISETYLNPVNSMSICFRGLIVNRQMPAHTLGDYYELLEIKIRE